MNVSLLMQHLGLHGRVQRTHGVLTEDFERHPLAQITQGAAVDEQRLFRMGEHVDEARRDGFAACIDFAASVAGDVLADVGDAVAIDRHIAHIRCIAGAVVDEAAPNDDVMRPARGAGHGGARRRCGPEGQQRLDYHLNGARKDCR